MRERTVLIRSLFSRRPASGLNPSPAAAPNPTEEPEQLTPEQLMDLKDAWTELSSAAEAAGVRRMRACTHDGSAWEQNAKAVRSMAAMISELPGLDTAASTDDGPAR